MRRSSSFVEIPRDADHRERTKPILYCTKQIKALFCRWKMTLTIGALDRESPGVLRAFLQSSRRSLDCDSSV